MKSAVQQKQNNSIFFITECIDMTSKLVEKNFSNIFLYQILKNNNNNNIYTMKLFTLKNMLTLKIIVSKHLLLFK